MPGWLIAMFISYCIVTLFAIVALGWRDELKTYRRMIQSGKLVERE